ncbi:MAG: transglutaminase-like cysteine peptidase [Burkholderiaceae bacterium]
MRSPLLPFSRRTAPARRGPARWRAGAAGLALALAGFGWSGTALQAWDQDRMLAAAQKVGPGAVAGVRALQPVLAAALPLDDLGKLAVVNDFFNRRIVFREDIEIWGQLDYWASPLETLNQGQGDCEDYAIAKYFSLLALGMPTARLRMVYVLAQVGGPGGAQMPHMVLAYYAAPGAEPMILDNLLGELRSASRRADLTPVFSFNSDGLWQGTGGPSAGDPVARLSRWRGVLAKARPEGFQ